MPLNMFPMTVTTPDGTAHQSCRVVGDGRTVTVWQWSGAEFVIVAQADEAGMAGNGPTWTLATDAGTVTIDRQNGCGCGHPLKAYTPTADEAKGARRLYTDPEVAPDA